MSNVLAIAAVTEALSNLVESYLPRSLVGGYGMSTTSPDDTPNLANPGVNIFLYQVSPNAALRNADLPTRTGTAKGSSLLRRPQAALDLHYLLTFYGNPKVLEPQRLLGAATLALHAHPVLTRSDIQAVQSPTGPDSFLKTSNLDTQSELIRFTPIVYSIEELSKLWSFLLKVDYVLSTAYVASVVLIDDEDVTPLPPALPVLPHGVRLTAQAVQQPVITQVVALPNAGSPPNASTPPITAGSEIALIGRNLAAPSGGATQVLIGGAAQTPATIGPTRITLTLPGGLKAGPQTAQVMQPLLLGKPAVLHPGTGGASGIATFVLNPMIAPGSPPSTYAISVEHGVGSPPGTAIAVTIIPTVQAGQRALLQLLPQASPPAAALLFDSGTLTEDSNTVTFPVPDLLAGNYLVRVLVDGAESPLTPGAGGVLPSVSV